MLEPKNAMTLEYQRSCEVQHQLRMRPESDTEARDGPAVKSVRRLRLMGPPAQRRGRRRRLLRRRRLRGVRAVREHLRPHVDGRRRGRAR